jgi:CheY-like chemotaxis protein
MLRQNPCTQSIPVVFMTARTQTYECEHFLALGAAGVIAKPFDPMTLASLLTGFFRDGDTAPDGRDALRSRLDTDLPRLVQCRSDLEISSRRPFALATTRDIAHRLVATVGVCGYCACCDVSDLLDAARTLEGAATSALSGNNGGGTAGDRIDALLTQIERFPPIRSCGQASRLEHAGRPDTMPPSA